MDATLHDTLSFGLGFHYDTRRTKDAPGARGKSILGLDVYIYKYGMVRFFYTQICIVMSSGIVYEFIVEPSRLH